jgi:hypothetical protein
MANLDRPFGLRPISNGPAGTAPQLGHYSVSSTLAAAIYEGDILVKGPVGVYSLTSLSGTVDQVHSIIGVSAQYLKGTPGSGASVVVYDDPLQRYEVQADDNTLDTAAECLEAIGHFFKPAIATGNTTTLQSKMELDGDSGTSVRDEETLLQVVRVAQGIDNSVVASGSWTRFVVQFTKEAHIFTSNTLTTLT